MRVEHVIADLHVVEHARPDEGVFLVIAVAAIHLADGAKTVVGTRAGASASSPSGGYGYTIGKSVALALVDDDFAGEGTDLSVHIVGVERPARVIAASPYDPDRKAMRQ